MRILNATQAATNAFLTLFLVAFTSQGAESKPLTKTQAVQLLSSMGYEQVQVAAVIQQQGEVSGAPNSATVIGVARREGKAVSITTPFHYDNDVGWFHYEFDGNEAMGQPIKLRMWTLAGYNEIQARFSIPDSEAAERIVGNWKQITASALEGIPGLQIPSLSFTYTKDGQWQAKGPKGSLNGTWKIAGGAVTHTFSDGTIDRWQIDDLGEARLTLKKDTETWNFRRNPATVESGVGTSHSTQPVTTSATGASKRSTSSSPEQIRRVAKALMDNVISALASYKVDTGGYPEGKDGLGGLLTKPSGATKWSGPYCMDIADPWGHNFVYQCPGIHNPSSYDLSSMGPDGKVGGGDDITNW